MDFEAALAEAKRAAASSFVRDIVPVLEKAQYILANYTVSTRAVAAALCISPSAVHRAAVSAKAGRSPGKRGRPAALSEIEEKSLLAWSLAEWAAKDGVSAPELLEKVRLHPRFLPLLTWSVTRDCSGG